MHRWAQIALLLLLAVLAIAYRQAFIAARWLAVEADADDQTQTLREKQTN